MPILFTRCTLPRRLSLPLRSRHVARDRHEYSAPTPHLPPTQNFPHDKRTNLTRPLNTQQLVMVIS
ncbi:hypothetical protein CHELA40_10846 [Chelatococcus asaccharovorans]|nr:hypothetical protein CHELA40_10846 [Chelatococcus asaccharovorans]